MTCIARSAGAPPSAITFNAACLSATESTSRASLVDPGNTEAPAARQCSTWESPGRALLQAQEALTRPGERGPRARHTRDRRGASRDALCRRAQDPHRAAPLHGVFGKIKLGTLACRFGAAAESWPADGARGPMYSTVYNWNQKRVAIKTNIKFEHNDGIVADSHSDLFGPPICLHSPIGKATAMVVTYDSATISCHLYGDIKSYVIIYLRKQRAT